MAFLAIFVAMALFAVLVAVTFALVALSFAFLAVASVETVGKFIFCCFANAYN